MSRALYLGNNAVPSLSLPRGEVRTVRVSQIAATQTALRMGGVA